MLLQLGAADHLARSRDRRSSPGTNGARRERAAPAYSATSSAIRCRSSSLALHGLVHRRASAHAARKRDLGERERRACRALARYALCHAPICSRAAVERPARAPAQPRARLRAVELQVIRLVRLRRRVAAPTTAPPPQARSNSLDHPPHRSRVLVGGPEVPGLREGRAVAHAGVRRAAGSPTSGSSTCCQGRTASGLRMRDRRRRASIARKQSGTSRSAAQSPPPITLPARAVAMRDAVLGVPRGVEEGIAVGGGDEFGAALAAAVGIVAAHRVVLAIAPEPFAVLVALVAGDDDHRADGRRRRARPRAGGRCPSRWWRRSPPGRHRTAAPAAARRGGRRSPARPRAPRPAPAAASRRSANAGVHALGDAAGVEQRRRRSAAAARSPLTFAPSACSHSDSQPPLKPVWPVTSTRRPRQNAAIHSQTFHGALPDCHSSSSRVLSRSVSIGCQKPRWRKAPSWPSAASRSSGSRSQSVSSPSM